MNDLIADSRTTTWTMDHSDRDDITYDAHHSNNRDSNVLSKSKIKQFTMLKIMDKLRYSHVCVFVRRCWWSSHLPCFDSTLFWKIFYTFFYLSTSSCRQIHDWRRCKNRKKCQFFCVVLLFIENSWNLSISLPWFMFYWSDFYVHWRLMMFLSMNNDEMGKSKDDYFSFLKIR